MRREVVVSPDSLAFLRRALYGVVYDAKGTADKSSRVGPQPDCSQAEGLDKACAT